MKTLEELLKDYANDSTELADAEIQKSKIELQSLDLSSKETMAKLTSQLAQHNEEYQALIEKITTLKSSIAVADKIISVTRELINKNFLKSPENVDSFLSSVYG